MIVKNKTCVSPAWAGLVQVTENLQVGLNTYRIRVQTDGTFPMVRAGQFAMLRLPNTDDPLLGRPLAVYSQTDSTLDFVYLVVGKMTRRLKEQVPGTTLKLWGPLGNGFADCSKNVIAVAGGIGHTPFLLLAQTVRQQGGTFRLLYGAKSTSHLSCIDDFRAAGAEVHLATEDGSTGHNGFVTDILTDVLTKFIRTNVPKPEPTVPSETVICTCGPTPMLRRTAAIAAEFGIPCYVSLESPMACGMGICFSCVVEYLISDVGVVPPLYDYRRTCIDGPVFDATRIRF